MKQRILKVIPYLGIITAVIFTACKDSYDANAIPSGSTDKKEMNEQYNGVSDETGQPVKNNSPRDTAKSDQMHPDNTTGAVTSGTSPKK